MHSSLSAEKSQSIRESQASSPTLAAAARLSAMIHGKDQVYANAMLVDQVSWGEIFLCGVRQKKPKTIYSRYIVKTRFGSKDVNWSTGEAAIQAVEKCGDLLIAFSLFVFQVDDADIKYRSPGEEEGSPASHVVSSSWDSFSVTPPSSGNYSQSRCPSSPHNTPRGIQGSGLENHREQSPRISPPSPFASSPSFPSSPLASALRLFEGAHKHQPQTGLPLSPSLSRRGYSFTEANRGLR